MKDILKSQIVQNIDKLDMHQLHILKGFIDKLLGLIG